MNSFLLRLTSISLLVSIISKLIPSKRLENTVNQALKLVCIFVLVSPIIGFTLDLKEKNYIVDESFRETAEVLSRTYYEQVIEQKLESEFQIPIRVSLEKPYTFSLIENGIEQNEEHIMIIDRIERYLLDHYGLEVSYEAS